MQLWDIFSDRKQRMLVVIIIALIIIYLALRFLILQYDPLKPLLFFIFNPYLLLIERFANLILQFSGSPVHIKNHIILQNGMQLNDFMTEVMYKKIMILLLLIFWFTNTTIARKLWFSLVLIILHFLFVAIYNTIGAHFAAYDDQYRAYFTFIPHTIGYLCIIMMFFFWFRYNKESLLNSLTIYKINILLFEKTLYKILILICIYLIVIRPSLLYLNFTYWINFLFKSSQSILLLLGFEAKVESFYLIGTNGSIFMTKSCLGFKTMFLFAAIVYLTGNNRRTQFLFIISGLLFLNLVNVLRFVLLFIHIQKHGGYALAMDLHTLYTSIIYFFVFVLWVIWYEKYSDVILN